MGCLRMLWLILKVTCLIDTKRPNINNKFSTWKNIFKGVPEGYVLAPLFFHIFINDMFNFIENCYLSKYADDNTL